MTQATGIYYERIKKLLENCDDTKQASDLIIDVALHTGFNKKQREQLTELYKEKSGYKYYTCRHCAEKFKSQIDLDAHQFNNKHCPANVG